MVRQMGASATGFDVEFDPRPIYDFLVSFVAADDDLAELAEEDRRWLTESRAAISKRLRHLLDFEKRRSGPPNLAAMAVAFPELQGPADYVRAVEQQDAREVVRVLLQDLLEQPKAAPFADAALHGDRDAIARVQDACGPEPDLALLRDQAATIATLREGLRYWLARYEPLQERVSRALERDVAIRRDDRSTLDPPALVERTTGGIQFLADAGVRRVLLAPVYFGRPYNYVFSADGWRLFCYPIADSAIGEPEGDRPPAATVRLYRALGDPTRLRILKLLSQREHYLTELAQQLELSKPTVKHHLAQLRFAGLVTLIEEGSLTYYSLRWDRVQTAGAEVQAYLSS